MKTIFKLFILTFLFASCNSESIVDSLFYKQEAFNRAVPKMAVQITRTDQTVLNALVSKLNVVHTSGNQFSITLNYGSDNEVVYIATQVVATEPGSKIKVVKAPFNITYTNKSSFSISANSTDKLVVNLQPGNINTNAISIVGEDSDGI